VIAALIVCLFVIFGILIGIIAAQNRQSYELEKAIHRRDEQIDRVRKVTIENAAVYPEAMSLVENVLSDRRELQ